MTESARAIAFLAAAPAASYGDRFARLRWRRAAGVDSVRDWEPNAPAAAALSESDEWVVVTDAAAVPVGSVPSPSSGQVLRCRPGSLPAVHTLRELEASKIHAYDGATSAIAFRTEDAAPLARRGTAAPGAPGAREVTCAELFAALAARGRGAEGFVSVAIPDASDAPRPEIARRIPDSAVRILDVGCGAGGALTAVARRSERRITGIERDARAAAAARRRCDRVVEGDLSDALPRLAAEGERFDAIVFADVLEHLEEPVDALAAAREAAAPGALLLVSVPNVGHLSLARDLLLGRFDPAPSGLEDAGHLRWFSRTFLEESILEAGWSAPRIERESGAPAPDPAAFLELAALWPDADRESLETYQWIATAAHAIP
ncbi:MAG TPA: methyltransferase domain-containing protein [Thermoanaerobaculia bacterium]|nr:methyltransferase domain-containing protein [Thermoanaerobaculia bacterium]